MAQNDLGLRIGVLIENEASMSFFYWYPSKTKITWPKTN
jgi:hypothetical protein